MSMRVILMKKHKGEGIGDTLEVSRGEARYLIAQGKVVRDDAETRARVSVLRSELEHQATEALKAANLRAVQLQSLNLQITSRAADGSRLYGSLGARELAKVIQEAGVPIEKKEIILSEGPIRRLGAHPIGIQLHPDIYVTLTIQVLAAV